MADGIFWYPLRRFREWSGGSTALIDWMDQNNTFLNYFLNLNNIPWIILLLGYNKEDIKVQIEEGNVLSIKGEGLKKEEKEKKEDLVWHLPENVKTDQVKAYVDNGLLTVVVPKDTSPKSSEVRNINITSKL
ncbi:hypothetical protein Bca52824_047071 [Brassica carinata]|uniref:SHSP domain-containing protein n=1 Tax=Brassica carinata TaxID=52824 RepID=A0A8X7RGB6_BRACI|nr:hypothetical protein Bca52824_047071 [Brassica carinata]